jgi:hypothetical protein
VEKFRIPAFYLTHDSPYFAELVSLHAPGRVLHIIDKDVSSSAFANLLNVIRPPCVAFRSRTLQTLTIASRLGVVPISTLTEWTDVLHLSCKWGFTHLRDAAIKALVPLTLPVDRLVLARKHGLSDWIEAAHADLIKRDEDLTEVEVEKMSSKDVFVIANGRAGLRAAKVRLALETQRVLQEAVLPVHSAPWTDPLNSLSSTPGPRTPTSLSSTPDPRGLSSQPLLDVKPERPKGPNHDRALAELWVSEIQDHLAPQTVLNRLVQFLRDDTTRVALILEFSFKSAWEDLVPLIVENDLERPRKPDSRPGFAYADYYHSKWFRNLHLLHDKCPTLELLRSRKTSEAALCFVDCWSLLLRMDLSKNQATLTQSSTWGLFICQIKFLGCCSYAGLFSDSVFSLLWTNMRGLIGTASPKHKLSAALVLQLLIWNVGYYMTSEEAGHEIDRFYQEIATELSETRDRALRDVLSVCYEATIYSYFD